MQHVVVKELLQYEILWSLDNAGFLRYLTFHEGTALRLCYGANRLSEDLDFTGGPGFTKTRVEGMSSVVQSHLTDRYDLDVLVKEPNPRMNSNQPIGVNTWQFRVVTHPDQSDRPRQRIKIDIATLEAQTKEVHAIQQNYSVLPSGIGDLLVLTMSKDEILGNKLVSLPASVYQKNIRYRDIWDIAWLVQNGARVKHEWIVNRVTEFKLTDYTERLDAMRDTLSDHVDSEKFRKEMSRFLPHDVVTRTLNRPEFTPYVVSKVDEYLIKARDAFSKPKKIKQSNNDFKM